jgi:hypothetical protein
MGSDKKFRMKVPEYLGLVDMNQKLAGMSEVRY